MKSNVIVGEATHTIPDNAGVFVADSIALALMDVPNIVLIERSQLEKILGEHQLSLTGVINNPDFELLGKILPVDALVIGNTTTFATFRNRAAWGGEVAYSARLVNIRSGEMLFSISCNGAKHGILPEQLANDLSRDAIKKIFEK